MGVEASRGWRVDDCGNEGEEESRWGLEVSVQKSRMRLENSKRLGVIVFTKSRKKFVDDEIMRSLHWRPAELQSWDHSVMAGKK